MRIYTLRLNPIIECTACKLPACTAGLALLMLASLSEGPQPLSGKVRLLDGSGGHPAAPLLVVPMGVAFCVTKDSSKAKNSNEHMTNIR